MTLSSKGKTSQPDAVVHACNRPILALREIKTFRVAWGTQTLSQKKERGETTYIFVFLIIQLILQYLTLLILGGELEYGNMYH